MKISYRGALSAIITEVCANCIEGRCKECYIAECKRVLLEAIKKAEKYDAEHTGEEYEDAKDDDQDE